jgi:hypothetical protein
MLLFTENNNDIYIYNYECGESSPNPTNEWKWMKRNEERCCPWRLHLCRPRASLRPRSSVPGLPGMGCRTQMPEKHRTCEMNERLVVKENLRLIPNVWEPYVSVIELWWKVGRKPYMTKKDLLVIQDKCAGV